jgi:formate dehydrogenase gamma subunit
MSTAGTFVRFSKRQRIEHFLVMSVFLILALTGFPQKFFETGWARSVVDLLGGIERVRFIHRVAGFVFSFLTIVHLATAAAMVVLGRARLSVLPDRKDFTDAILQIRYYLGLTETQARFDRFDYRQKFEYWGLVLGGLVMVATGLVLYFPILVTRFLPGQLIPAAKVAHSNEGLMAFLVVLTWHIFNAHLAPGIFPYDKSIFTGEISAERMRHEHPIEYERLTGEPVPAHGPSHPPAPAPAAEPKEPQEPRDGG